MLERKATSKDPALKCGTEAVFLDENSGAPLHPKVREVLQAFLSSEDSDRTLLGNPSSIHSFGRKLREQVRLAQDQVRDSLHSSSHKITFTSSGTEANHLAIRSALSGSAVKTWFFASTDHASVVKLKDEVKSTGVEVWEIPVDSKGQLDLAFLERNWPSQGLALVSVAWVNNETGVIAPVTSLGRLVRQNKGLLHLDGAQAWGKIPISLDELEADYVSFSGHKIGAPAGIGVLASLSSVRLLPRSGTPNLLGCIGIGVAAQSIQPDLFQKQMFPVQAQLEGKLRELFPNAPVHGSELERVAGTTYIGLFEDAVIALDLEGIAVSAGSACAAGSREPSHVLLAMGCTRAEALASVRISYGLRTPVEAFERLLFALERISQRNATLKVNECKSSSSQTFRLNL